MPALGWRWALAGPRIAAIIAWFLAVLPPHLLLTLAGRRDAVPPLFLAGVGRLAGLRLRLEGRPVPGRLLLVANHVSWLDVMVLAGAARTAFAGHGGLASRPFLRWLCEQNDTVFVARERRGTVSAQVGEVAATLARRRLVIFPEGTTGDGRSLLPFKSALFSAAERAAAADEPITVQPVALDYEAPEEIAWVGNEPGLANVLRILARTRPLRVTVRFRGPLRGAQLADRKSMAGAAQAAVASALLL